MAKRVKKFLEDYRRDGEAELEVTFSLWHIIIPLALIVLAIYVLNR